MDEESAAVVMVSSAPLITHKSYLHYVHPDHVCYLLVR
jgi:hypothetical protein